MTANEKVPTRFQDDQLHKSVFFDLRSSNFLAKWPIVGLLMFVFGSLMFGGLTYNLFAHGPLLAWDKTLANTLPAIGLKSPAFIKGLMDAGFYIGKEVIIVLGVLLAFYFFRKRYWQELTMMAIGEVGAALLFHFVSTFIARPRPPTQIWIILKIPGFPSGHALSVVVFYGFLAYLLVPKMPSFFWKIVVVATALLIIVFVGFSRIFTGGHYLTDILAGYAAGLAWSGMVYTLIEIYFQKRRSQNAKKEQIHSS
ncbi:MAG: phosphatase PAP2 family protein [Chloroflexota bacterium]